MQGKQCQKVKSAAEKLDATLDYTTPLRNSPLWQTEAWNVLWSSANQWIGGEEYREALVGNTAEED